MSDYADFKTAPTYVNTILQKGLQDIFSNPQKGVFETYTYMSKSGSNQNALTAVGGTPGMRKWLGSKVFNQLREFVLNTTTDNFEDTLDIPKDTLKYDQTGDVMRRVDGFLGDQLDFYATEAVKIMVTNPTGMDGVALFSASHPYADQAGNVQSNYGTTALSMAQLDAIRIIMNAYTYEGKLLNVTPDTLVVGPKLLRLALDICESPLRVVGIDASGLIDSGTRIAAAAIQQVYPGGKMTVVEDRRLVGTYDDYYFVLDSKFKGGKPVIGIVADPPHLVPQNKETDWFRFMNNRYLWSVEANVGFFPYNPFCCYGSYV
jgi:phage major head subunit gpT-like protein